MTTDIIVALLNNIDRGVAQRLCSLRVPIEAHEVPEKMPAREIDGKLHTSPLGLVNYLLASIGQPVVEAQVGQDGNLVKFSTGRMLESY